MVAASAGEGNLQIQAPDAPINQAGETSSKRQCEQELKKCYKPPKKVEPVKLTPSDEADYLRLSEGGGEDRHDKSPPSGTSGHDHPVSSSSVCPYC